MKRFSEMSQVRVGIVGLAAVAMLLTAAVNAGQIKGWFTGSTYSAAFAEAGGLRAGNEVRISGYQVGTVESVTLERDHVVVRFSNDGPALGSRTTASIKTGTALGTKFVNLEPAGAAELGPGARIPLRQTKSPYDVTEAVSELTRTTGRIDTQRLAQSFDTLANTFENTPPRLRDALDGVKRLSRTVASRDVVLRQVLRNASGVSSVLSERNGQLTRLLTDGNLLLEELQARRDTVQEVLTGVREASEQLTGFARDNAGSLTPALGKLQDVAEVLAKNADSLDKALGLVGRFGRALSEGVGSGPYFHGYVQNLPPTNLAPVLPALFDNVGNSLSGNDVSDGGGLLPDGSARQQGDDQRRSGENGAGGSGLSLPGLGGE